MVALQKNYVFNHALIHPCILPKKIIFNRIISKTNCVCWLKYKLTFFLNLFDRVAMLEWSRKGGVIALDFMDTYGSLHWGRKTILVTRLSKCLHLWEFMLNRSQMSAVYRSVEYT